VLLFPSLLALSACSGDFRADVVVSDDVPTVATVTFDFPSSGQAWIEWGENFANTTRPGLSPGPSHELLLAGLPAGRPVVARAVLDVDGARYVSDTLRFRTGALDTELAGFDPSDGVDDWSPTFGYVVTTTIGYPSSVIILDASGAPVWWYVPGGGKVVTQAYLDPNGTEVWLNLANVDFSIDDGEVRRVRLDGTVLEQIRTPLSHHDFVRTAAGGVAYLAIDARDVDGSMVVGDAVVEQREGVWSTRWSAFDSLDPTGLDPDDDSGFYPQGHDWTHANSLFEEPGGAWTVSLRNLNQLVSVQDGQVRWSIGGDASLAPLDVSRTLIGQHSPSWTEDGHLLVFDNGDPLLEDAYSRVVELEVDPEAGTYREVWSFDHERRHSAYLLGDVERLEENGHTLVSWGSAGVMTEVDAQDRVVWQVNTGIGHPMAFMHPVPPGPCLPGAAEDCLLRTIGGVVGAAGR
jgi:hypothetical protein